MFKLFNCCINKTQKTTKEITSIRQAKNEERQKLLTGKNAQSVNIKIETNINLDVEINSFVSSPQNYSI